MPMAAKLDGWMSQTWTPTRCASSAAWLDAARAAGQPMPEAMTIASATSDGVPSARLVVLRGLRRGLVFFTDCESDKGAELAANPRAAAVLHWLVPAHRQVRVAGQAEPVNEDEADEYWSTRAPPPVSRGRLPAKPRHRQPDGPGHAGPGRAAAPPRRSRHSPAAALGRLSGAAVPRRVLAESPDGLHDRIRYRQAGSGWIIERLSP